MPKKSAKITFSPATRKKALFCGAGALILTLALVLAVGIYSFQFNHSVVEVTLLQGQPYTLKGRSLVKATSGLPEVLDYDKETRTVTPQQLGEGSLRTFGRLRVTDYQFHVVDAQPQSGKSCVLTIGDTHLLNPQKQDAPVVWASSDDSIAQVDEHGSITCHTAGTCQVTETINDYLTYTYQVNVLSPILPQEELAVYEGETAELSMLNYHYPVEWTADSDCVTLDQTDSADIETLGTTSVTGETVGTTELSTTVGGQEITATVSVSPPPVVPETMELYVGESSELPVENVIDEVNYHSTSEDSAQVDENGIITASAPGTTQIIATIREQQVSCELTVKLPPEEEFKTTNYGDYQPDTSIAALTLIGMCERYNDFMKADKADWYNSNIRHDVTDVDTFREMTTAKVKGTNCNTLTNWALIDMGLVPEGLSLLYGDEDAKLHGYDSGGSNLKKFLEEGCTVTMYDQKKDLRDLIREGKVQAGDMVFNRLHTFIYRGDNTVFGSANDGKVHWKGSYQVFDDYINSVKKSYDRKKKVTYVVHFKEDYIPQYYYNKDAELVENPLYTAIHQDGYQYDPPGKANDTEDASDKEAEPAKAEEQKSDKKSASAKG